MVLQFANRTFALGGPELGPLREAPAGIAAQRVQLAEDGYLLLRGLHEPARVEEVRRIILEDLDANDQIDRRFPLMDGVVKEGAKGRFLGGSKALTRNAAFLALVESAEVMGWFAQLFQADSATFDYKWLRVVAPGDFTGAHYDIVYMGRGTLNVCTLWTPLGDVTYDMGPLAVLENSHRNPAFDRVRETYGRMDVDRDHVTGAFSNDPQEMLDRYGGRWLTTEFKAGDALVFGMFTLHASLTNVSRRYRLSCDTRYQRADEPMDERWVGEDPPAHYAWTQGETVPMEEARRRWKV